MNGSHACECVGLYEGVNCEIHERSMFRVDSYLDQYVDPTTGRFAAPVPSCVEISDVAGSVRAIQGSRETHFGCLFSPLRLYFS